MGRKIDGCIIFKIRVPEGWVNSQLEIFASLGKFKIPAGKSGQLAS